MSRKALALKNLGGQTQQDIEATIDPRQPALARNRTNVVMVERVILAILRQEVARLSNVQNQDDFEQFMSHFFDPLAGEEERAQFVTNFQRRPPTTVLGYPRTTTEMPCYAVVLEQEEEHEDYLAELVGATDVTCEDGPPAQYQGSYWKNTYGVYVYAEHPDVCAYLYQVAKMILFGAHDTLVYTGFIDPSFSGGELAPEAMAIPENMYLRTLRVSGRSLISVPKFVPNPANFRVHVFHSDVVVDGVAGKVTPYEPESG